MSNQSPTVTEPSYVRGSKDILTNINGYAQRRPGFSATVEPSSTAFHSLQRMFTWDDFQNNFYVMFSDVTPSSSTVYKMQVGVDTSAVLLYTDNGSNQAFDYVVSNGTVYFGNGHVMLKWSPNLITSGTPLGVQKWGIAVGSVNNATGPNTAGTGTNDGSSPGGFSDTWASPANVSSAVSYATCTETTAGSITKVAGSKYLNATQFGFGLSSTNTVLGIGISFEALYAGFPSSVVQVRGSILKGGVVTGPDIIFANISTSNATYTYGGTSYLWGTTWTPNDVNQTTFGLALYTSVSSGSVAQTGVVYIRNVRITVYGLGGPNISVAAGAGSFSATVGYEYVFTYGNSLTGHMSSPTPASASTGIFSNKANVSIDLTASTDPQVNQIHLFRTTDSAAPGTTGGTFFELPSSPYPNTTQTVTDNAPDTALNIFSIAPAPGFNDPPPPSFGFVYFSGRIWMCDGINRNKVWFTGLEEINNGVPEESVPSGISGNFWKFDQTAQGLGVAGVGNNQTLAVFCGGRLYGINGNSLDTFRRFLVSNRRGCRQIKTITMLGGMCAWFDTANQVWATDGNSIQELSIPIRTDLLGGNLSDYSMSFHTAGLYHWLVLSTGSQLFVYDVDQEQWMPPWTHSSQYVFSGETAPGDYQLMSSFHGTKALELDSAYNDDGSTYQPVIRTNLFSMVPDFGRRFSYLAAGIYDEPTRTGMPWYFQVDTSQVTLEDVAFIADDDPTQGTYSSIVSQKQDVSVTYNRKQGAYIYQNVYPSTQPMSRWVGWQFTLPAKDEADNIYGWCVAYSEKK